MNIQRLLLLTTVSLLITFVGFSQTGSTPVYLKFRTDKVYILNEGQIEITADVYIGTWENPARDLYATTFDLAFPTDITAPELTSFTYNTSSFLGKREDVTVLNKNPQVLKEGKLSISINRKDLKSVSGFEKIGEAKFIVLADIIGSRNIPETPFTIKLENVQLLDTDGNELPSETDADGATIIIVNDILARQLQQQRLQQIEIYPNPSSDQISINLQNIRGERIELFNAAGQRVKGERVRGEQVTISTKGLKAGLYTVKIQAEEGVITRRVLVQ